MGSTFKNMVEDGRYENGFLVRGRIKYETHEQRKQMNIRLALLRAETMRTKIMKQKKLGKYVSKEEEDLLKELNQNEQGIFNVLLGQFK